MKKTNTCSTIHNSNTFAQGSNSFVSSTPSEERNSKYVYLLSLFINSIIEGPNAWNKEVIKNIAMSLTEKYTAWQEGRNYKLIYY
jgi:hypothetical protein